MLRLCFFALFISLLVACQPIHYSSSHLGEEVSLSGNSIARLNSHRLGQPEFKDIFTSYKLDLVFVLDTHSNMTEFYKKNLFGSDFLDRLQNYDWKLAYTDMSVNPKYLEEKKQPEESSEESSCDFFSGLLLAGGAVAVISPWLMDKSFKSMSGCFESSSNPEENIKNSAFSDGSFLPFEQKGQKMEAIEGYYQINESTDNYNDIFAQSFQLHSDRKKPYESPQLRKTDSYPFLASTSSLLKGGLLIPEDSDTESSSFFREDSLIVYVLVTTQDIKIDTSSETYTRSVEFLADQQRIKIIPVTVTQDTTLFCSLEFPNAKTATELLNLSEELGSQAVDICSSDLGDELFKEISRSLHSQNLLK